MFKSFKIFALLTICCVFAMCNTKAGNDSDTILSGNLELGVDETIVPIVEDQVAVFEGTYYGAKIKIKPKAEAEILNDLLNQKTKVAIMSRTLSEEELARFSKSKIKPRITIFASDAIALIRNNKVQDTLIDLSEVVNVLKGRESSTIKGIVFDNPNSSTVRFMKELAQIKELPLNNVFSFKTNEEVIKFVADNEGMIGVVGVNWLSQPTKKISELLNNLNVLSVKGLGENDYFSPTQNDLAVEKYPLARDLFIINCQGMSGLGMGFSSFIAGDIGQRVVLKSGLLPVRTPGRKLSIRKEITRDKE